MNFTGPPPGPLTDYCDLKFAGLWEGPEPNNGPGALAALWALFAAASIFTAVRFYCKIGRNRGPGLWWDDLFMGVTWVSPLRPRLPPFPSMSTVCEK